MSKETDNYTDVREALEEVSGVLERIRDAFKNGTGGVDMWEVNEVLGKSATSLAKPQRNCDKFPYVDVAYNQFMNYVKRENPSFTKESPLHTVWDALKWVLDGERKEADA